MNTQAAAQGFCDNVVKTSIVSIASHSVAKDDSNPTNQTNIDKPQLSLANESEYQFEVKSSFENEPMVNESSARDIS